MSLTVPSQGTAGEIKNAVPLNDWEIPRNELRQRAGGQRERGRRTGAAQAGAEEPFYADEQADWQDELEVPLPG